MAVQEGMEIDKEAYKAGIEDALENAPQRLSDEEMQMAFAEQQNALVSEVKTKNATE